MSYTTCPLDPDLYTAAWQTIDQRPGWRYIAMHGDHYWHWNWPVTTLTNTAGDLESIWLPNVPESIKCLVRHMAQTHRDLRVNRVVINGQTRGMNSARHRDSIKSGARTLLAYLNPAWQHTWGGHTVFFQADQEIHRVLPEPGLMLDYDSTQYHQGLGPEVDHVLRVTLSVQMVPLNTRT